MAVSISNNAPPISTAVDVYAQGGLRLALPWSLWFNWLYTFVTSKVNYSNAIVYVAVTGFNYTLGNTQTLLTVNPAGALATGTVTMPPLPYDGMPVEIASTQAIATFTLSPNSGQTVKTPPTSLTAGVGVAYYYNATSSTWFRRY